MHASFRNAKLQGADLTDTEWGDFAGAHMDASTKLPRGATREEMQKLGVIFED